MLALALCRRFRLMKRGDDFVRNLHRRYVVWQISPVLRHKRLVHARAAAAMAAAMVARVIAAPAAIAAAATSTAVVDGMRSGPQFVVVVVRQKPQRLVDPPCGRQVFVTQRHRFQVETAERR